MKLRSALPVLALVTLAGAAPAQQVWHVDAAAPAGGDGTSWASAFDTLDDALDVVQVFDQVWMRAGTYRPAVRTNPADPRSATFWVPSGTVILGGFAGDERSPTQRPDGPRTVLSGDLGAAGDPSDNAYNVVTVFQWSTLPPRNVFDSLTIEDGNANGTGPDGAGGGMYVNNSNVLLSRCRLRRNNAFEGGALYAALGEVQTRWCTLEDNTAARGGAIYGTYGTLNVYNTLLRNNTASAKGGAYFAYSTLMLPDSAKFVGCTFYGNAANNGGVAYVRGWKMFSGFPTHVSFFSCTLAGNVAAKAGGAIFEDAGAPFPPTTRVIGSILWGNRAAIGPEIQGAPTVRFSTVAGGYAGAGNQAADPRFVDEAAGDFRLTGRSPCIDASSPSALPGDRVDLDWDGNVTEPVPLDALGLERVTGSRADMGAYEFAGASAPAATDPAGRTRGISIGTSRR